MNTIPFPSQYKKALVNKTKNVTLCIDKQIGKYEVGKIYSVTTYSGKPWNIKIKILNIFPTTLDKLFEFGIPKKSIEAMQKREKISLHEKVELIRFKILK